MKPNGLVVVGGVKNWFVSVTLKTPLSWLAGDRQLPPGVVELGPGVHQVEPVLQRDPLGGQEQVLQSRVGLVSVTDSRTGRPSMITSSSVGQPGDDRWSRSLQVPLGIRSAQAVDLGRRPRGTRIRPRSRIRGTSGGRPSWILNWSSRLRYWLTSLTYCCRACWSCDRSGSTSSGDEARRLALDQLLEDAQELLEGRDVLDGRSRRSGAGAGPGGSRCRVVGVAAGRWSNGLPGGQDVRTNSWRNRAKLRIS